METKDELLSEGEKYCEKVMQDFNQNRKGRNLRKYCNDEGIMYSLYESCKMNELDFGRYIEDILTRMKDGDKDYLSMLPCYYKAPEKQVEECA